MRSETAMSSDYLFTEDRFEEMFPNEETCVDYLFRLRWPRGFTCAICGHLDPSIFPSRSLACPNCGGHTSLTSGTVMHGTKKPLRQWLQAIWWICRNESGASARDLQRLLRLNSYQTAWTWLQKLRMVMSAADQEPCAGMVELGQGTVTPARSGRKGAEVLAAAEAMDLEGITGRIRMVGIMELDRSTLIAFIRRHVRPGSSIVAPGAEVYDCIREAGYIRVIDSPLAAPERVSELVQGFETWLNTVHRGGVQLKHLQLYLDEFCFRANSAMLPDAKAIFQALLLGCMGHKTIPYRQLVEG